MTFIERRIKRGKRKTKEKEGERGGKEEKRERPAYLLEEQWEESGSR